LPKEQDCCRHHRDKCVVDEASDTATAMAIMVKYSYGSDDEIKDSYESKNKEAKGKFIHLSLGLDAHCHFMVLD
jgi:hypothetical protein